MGKLGTRTVFRWSLTLACVLATVFAVTASAAAAAKQQGRSGVLTPSVGSRSEEAAFVSLEARPDGRIVAQRNEELATYLANGAPDPSAGRRKVDRYRQVFPIAGGRTLVLEKEKLTRLAADGSVDASFGAGGTVTLSSEWWNGAAELASGKTLLVDAQVGGTKGPIADVSVQLLDRAGNVDRGLGSDGVLRISLPGSYENGSVFEVDPKPDGGALVIGGGYILELRANGTPDPAFGHDGLVTDIYGLAGGQFLPDGSIEVIGASHDPQRRQLALTRLDSTGQIDRSFGSDGTRSFDLGLETEIHAALWAADGSVVVAGPSEVRGPCATETCNNGSFLAAFDSQGELDRGFGSDGLRVLSALEADDGSFLEEGVTAMVRRPDGSIVAAGSAPPERSVGFLAALSPDGDLLSDFGEGGIVRERRPIPEWPSMIGIAALADGKVLGAGNVFLGVSQVPVLVRYGADGGLDRSFGDGAGFVTLHDPEAGVHHFATSFAVDASGQALVTSGAYSGPGVLQLRGPDGALVGGFGSNGEVTLPPGFEPRALGFASAGGATVVGGSKGKAVVLRYQSDGSPEARFGRGGKVVLRGRGSEMTAESLISVPGDRLLVGGTDKRRFAIAKLLPDGRPDRRFGSRGWVLPRAGGNAKSILLRRVGSRIYAAGVIRKGDAVLDDGPVSVVLMRFHADGRPDRGFGNRGRRIASLPDIAEATAIVPSRRGIVVVLSNGDRPLLSFEAHGKVKRGRVSKGSQQVDGVQASAAGGRLVLGWNAFSRANRREGFYLGGIDGMSSRIADLHRNGGVPRAPRRG